MTLAEEQFDFRQWVDGQVLAGARLTSFIRSPAVNLGVGGLHQSQHLVGLGADFGLESAEQVIGSAAEEGYVAIVESDHVHVQRYPAGFLASCGVLA